MPINDLFLLLMHLHKLVRVLVSFYGSTLLTV